MTYSKIFTGSLLGLILAMTQTTPAIAAKRSKEKLHSAPEVFASTTADTSRADSENLSMDDLSDEPAKISEDSELDTIAVATEPKGAKGKGSVKERESIREDLDNLDSSPKLESRITALEKELQSLKSTPNTAVVQNSTVSEIKDTSRADLVPEHKKDSILKRLKIVETLIRKHGLAYDYRGMTTQQLEETLMSLNDPR